MVPALQEATKKISKTQGKVADLKKDLQAKGGVGMGVVL
jgi:hypothetical protein